MLTIGEDGGLWGANVPSYGLIVAPTMMPRLRALIDNGVCEQVATRLDTIVIELGRLRHMVSPEVAVELADIATRLTREAGLLADMGEGV